MAIQKVLGRLEKVRRKGEGQYMACCPAHDDKSPSLSVAESKDGRVLIKCFGGCGALDVITAIGLEWDDLFPESDKHYRSLVLSHGIKARESISNRLVDLAKHTSLTNKQREEAKQAAARGAEPDGFALELAQNLPEDRGWSEKLLECERELLRAEMFSNDEMRALAAKYPLSETRAHRKAIEDWESCDE